jgi:hypothetical protein
MMLNQKDTIMLDLKDMEIEEPTSGVDISMMEIEGGEELPQQTTTQPVAEQDSTTGSAWQQEVSKQKALLESGEINKAQYDQNLRDFSRQNKETQYLSGTIDNPLTATGSAILATATGLTKIVEDVTGWDLGSKDKVEKVKNVVENLSTDTKLFGDIAGASVVSPGSLVPASIQAGLQTLGEGENYSRAAGVTIGSLILGKAGEGLINSLTNKVDDKVLGWMRDLNQGRIDEQEFNKLFQASTPEDKALLFAEGNNLFRRHIEKAVETSDDAAKLGHRMEVRKNIVNQFRASDESMKKAGDQYGAMKEAVSKEAPQTFPTTSLQTNIESLDKIYKSDSTSVGTMIRNIATDLSEPVDARTAIEIRENINAMLRKPAISKSKVASGHLNSIKSALDTFVDQATSPELNQLIKETTNNYRQVKNDFEFGNLLDKNTKADYAVDWAGLKKDLKKEGLMSDRLELVIPVIKEFSEKFGNDKLLANTITPKGAGDAGGVLTFFSKAVEIIKDWAAPVIDRPRYKDLEIQKALIKAIRNSTDDPHKFIDNIILDAKAPMELKRKLTDEGSYLAPRTVGNFTSFTNYKGEMVATAKDLGNDVYSIETSGFKPGSGEGGKFYKGIFNWLDSNGYKFSGNESLTAINEIRLPVNYLKFKQANPNTKIFDANTEARFSKKLDEINTILTNRGINIGELDIEDISKLADELGQDPDLRLGEESLIALNKHFRKD